MRRAVKAQGKLAFLSRFYVQLQPSTSHYTFDGDGSERLMLKYFEYLVRIRTLLHERFGMSVLANLDDFPVDRDPSLREYHEKIASRIDALAELPGNHGLRSRYYVLKTRPFFVEGRIYYEVTFSAPNDRVSKFDASSPSRTSTSPTGTRPICRSYTLIRDEPVWRLVPWRDVPPARRRAIVSDVPRAIALRLARATDNVGKLGAGGARREQQLDRVRNPAPTYTRVARFCLVHSAITTR